MIGGKEPVMVKLEWFHQIISLQMKVAKAVKFYFLFTKPQNVETLNGLVCKILKRLIISNCVQVNECLVNKISINSQDKSGSTGNGSYTSVQFPSASVRISVYIKKFRGKHLKSNFI